jgi:Na+/phosphate symporter
MKAIYMKKLPKIELNQLTPFAVVVSVLGFCLMQTDDFKNLGAILFSLGLLPLALILSKHKD